MRRTKRETLVPTHAVAAAAGGGGTVRARMDEQPRPARTLGLLSVVTPMHDEEGNVRPLYERVAAALDGVDWELVITDDGSKDGTGRLLAELAAEDERVKVLTLSRNFGHQPAITAGLEHARGDA